MRSAIGVSTLLAAAIMASPAPAHITPEWQEAKVGAPSKAVFTAARMRRIAHFEGARAHT